MASHISRNKLGVYRGESHCEECSTQLVNRDRLSPGFIGQSHSLVLRRILRTCPENIAYNTLPYKFARMLLLPQDIISRYRNTLRALAK